MVNRTYVVCFFFPAWLWPLYGFYLNRFSALLSWSDDCNWYQTGVFSLLSHSQIKETIDFARYKFLYTELGVTKKCRWSYFKPGWPAVAAKNTRDKARINWIFLWIKLFHPVTTLAPTIYLGKPVGSRKPKGNIEWMIIMVRNED